MSDIRKAVFPVAGMGTRFLPATKVLPKIMLPLVDRPVIHYVVEEALAAGVTRAVFVTGRDQESIQDYFDRSIELEGFLAEKKKGELLEQIQTVSHMLRPATVRQKEAKGLGHAILCARDYVGEEPFAVFLPDDVIASTVPAIRQLIDARRIHGGSVILVEEVDPKDTKSYGVIKGTPVADGVYRIEDMVEKPEPHEAPSNLAIIGRYVLEPEIFPMIEKTTPGKGGEIQITDAIRLLLANRPVFAVKLAGKRYDTGDKLGYLKATVEFGLAHQTLGPAFRQYLETVRS